MHSTEDAAGSPSSTITGPPPAGRATARPRHRGGIKHRKAAPVKTAPPAQSSTPCPFGCGCWFRERCSFAHPVEDHALWQQERTARLALFDISTARKKARLEGRAARRSALSSLPTNTATENTGAVKEEHAKGLSDGAGTGTVGYTTTQPPQPHSETPTQSRGEAVAMATVKAHMPSENAIQEQYDGLHNGKIVDAFVTPGVFKPQSSTLSNCDAGQDLLENGIGWCYFRIRTHNSDDRDTFARAVGEDAHYTLQLIGYTAWGDGDNAKTIALKDILSGGIKLTLERMRAGQIVLKPT